MRPTSLFASFLLAASLSAPPVVTSVTPNSGPVEGGTTVTIRGSGFSTTCITCSPPFADPEVTFFGTAAASVKFIDDKTLEAVTPPHLPGRVSVTVRNFDGSEPFTLDQAFEFTGEPTAAFEPLLFPILSPPVRGAFGSEFHTRARIWNHDRARTARLYGIDTSCYLIDPPLYPQLPFPLPPSGPEHTLLPDCYTSLGRVLWVLKETDTVAANLRVTDVTRESASHGVEIPVVRLEELDDRVSLLGVPIDPRFRNTLRIYSLEAARVAVSFLAGGHLLETRAIDLAPGTNVFEPAMATITTFPATTAHTMTVVVEAIPPCPICPLPHIYPPIWAFITVTNNETQQITTVTPN